MILKKKDPRGRSGLPPSGGNIHVYITMIFKDIFSETVWPIKAKRLVEYS